MAVVRIATIENYAGTAAEMAGMTVTNVPTGSRFFQSDTGLWYVLVGSSWVKEIIPAA